MSYYVEFRSKTSLRSPAGFLGQVLNGHPPRGRKKSRMKAPWHWEIVFGPEDAHLFEDVRDAIRAAKRHGDKWANLQVSVVTTTGRTIWPHDGVDIVTAIGLLAV